KDCADGFTFHLVNSFYPYPWTLIFGIFSADERFVIEAFFGHLTPEIGNRFQPKLPVDFS
ncbi:hypothetical protein PSYMO_33762, partial [Pseudomonas amygdali pv. mori str. 301020]